MKPAKKKTNGKKNNKGQNVQRLSLPASFVTKTTTRGPQVNSRGGNTCRITHREMIGAVNRAVNYNCYSLGINPAMSTTFPWLSHIARNYEAYHFVKLRFMYEPVVGTSNNGLIMMTVDYDASDPDPTNELDFMSFLDSVQGPIHSGLKLECPVDRMRSLSGRLYTRWTAMAGNQDVKTYDVGKLCIAVAGGADATRCGSLYVEYTVDLFTPGIPANEEEYEDSAKIIGAGGGIAKATPFGAAATITQGNTFPLFSAINDTITFKEPGQYMLKTTVTGTGLQSGHAVTLGGTATAAKSDSINNVGQDSLWETYRIYVTQSLQTLTMAYNLATTVTGIGAYLTPFKYSLI